MSTETGGPAFPTKSYDLQRETWVREEGMTLRDYFAAKAMQGQIQRRGFDGVNPRTNISAKVVAAWAYEMADAMLEARK